jgi:hypothetical protein
MVDLLGNVDLPMRTAKAPDLSTFLLILSWVNLCILKRELHLSYHEIVLLALRCMRPKNQLLL